MLRKNLDVQDGLVNGACGVVQHVGTYRTGEVDKVWVKFEKDAGSKWQAANETRSVAIYRCSASFDDKDGNKAERRQFPLVLAKANTIHKSQAATYHAGVHVRLDKHVKQDGQAYVALSRSPTQALCTLERFDEASLHFNANGQRALVVLMERQARSSAPGRASLQQLWEDVARPAESHGYYQQLLHRLPRPNWQEYDEEQRAKAGPAENEAKKNGGKLACPRCGWVADDDVAYKKYKATCPAKKPPRPKAKTKQAPKPKTKTQSKGTTTEEADEGSTPAEVLIHRHLRAHRRCRPQQTHRHPTSSQQRSASSSKDNKQPTAECTRSTILWAGGWYSIQVLYTALFEQGYILDFHDPVQSMDQAHGAIGLIQNRENRHWVAYRWGGDGNIYLLDSMQLGPAQVSDQEVLASVMRHPTYAIEPRADLWCMKRYAYHFASFTRTDHHAVVGITRADRCQQLESKKQAERLM